MEGRPGKIPSAAARHPAVRTTCSRCSSRRRSASTPKTVNYVPYDGGGDLLTAILGNKIDFATSGTGEYVDQIEPRRRSASSRPAGRSGRRAIDAPTLKEEGVDLAFTNWRGVVAPPGISDADKQKWSTSSRRCTTARPWKEALVKNGWTDAFMTGAEFEHFLTSRTTGSPTS